MDHVHEIAYDREWLPTRNGLRPTVHCPCCGAVRAQGQFPAKRMGFFTNILGQVRTKSAPRCLTVGQIRLIVKELERNDAFEDRFQTAGEVQAHIFLHTVQKYAPGAVHACEQALPAGLQELWRVVSPA